MKILKYAHIPQLILEQFKRWRCKNRKVGENNNNKNVRVCVQVGTPHTKTDGKQTKADIHHC